MKNFLLLFCSLILGAMVLAPSVQAETRAAPETANKRYCPDTISPAEGIPTSTSPACAHPEGFDYKRCTTAKKSLQEFLSKVEFDKTGANSQKVLANIGNLTAKLNVACAFRPKVQPPVKPYDCSVRSTDGIMVCKGTDPKGPDQPDYDCKVTAERSDGLLIWECKAKQTHKPYDCQKQGDDGRILMCFGTDPKGPGKDVAPNYRCRKTGADGDLLIWTCAKKVSGCVPTPYSKCFPHPPVPMPQPNPPSCSTDRQGNTVCSQEVP
ncbi:MAG TPA: hypothetical protein PLO23_09625 [Alphaproteobacteria bacterium]|nr:hypothetical protein [Alphaproteobacteria bacterium]